jgi:hypothetical protein
MTNTFPPYPNLNAALDEWLEFYQVIIDKKANSKDSFWQYQYACVLQVCKAIIKKRIEK